MDNKAWAQEVAKKIKKKEIEVIKRSVNKVPYIAKNGVFDDLSETRLGWWTNGFWGGMMWQLYQATKEPIYKEVAENLDKEYHPLEPKYKEYLLCDMNAIYDCDAIFMCREWYDSKGCFAERSFADAIGLDILYQH